MKRNCFYAVLCCLGYGALQGHCRIGDFLEYIVNYLSQHFENPVKCSGSTFSLKLFYYTNPFDDCRVSVHLVNELQIPLLCSNIWKCNQPKRATTCLCCFYRLTSPIILLWQVYFLKHSCNWIKPISLLE